MDDCLPTWPPGGRGASSAEEAETVAAAGRSGGRKHQIREAIKGRAFMLGESGPR